MEKLSKELKERGRKGEGAREQRNEGAKEQRNEIVSAIQKYYSPRIYSYENMVKRCKSEGVREFETLYPSHTHTHNPTHATMRQLRLLKHLNI
ncbi:MAG: hypothetical protein AMS27_04325 [Bacteroides sp. SM23_62_1]|nr:MAG: hypothetical protein AMS27_04325 [Bacteroides sp. SM23_62_1]